jgi:hypothetical protein
MSFSSREAWTAVHGMIFGFGYLLFFTGSIALILTLREDLLTPKGLKRTIFLLKIAGIAQAVLVWFAVIVGTYIVYPWYRATPPKGTTDLTGFARSRLLANPATSGWHNLGMEWKEHLAWFSPLLVTAAVYLIFRYADRLAADRRAAWSAGLLQTAAFVVAGIVGVLGALITKAGPVV